MLLLSYLKKVAQPLQSTCRISFTVKLQENSVCRRFRQTAAYNKEYATKYYNLDDVISIGYWANSVRATQFRQWCTYVLRQFAIRGYVIDKKRMENGTFINEDYFEHLLADKLVKKLLISVDYGIRFLRNDCSGQRANPLKVYNR